MPPRPDLTLCMTLLLQTPKLPTAINSLPPAEMLEGGSKVDTSESEDDEEQDAIEDEGMPDVDMAGEDEIRHALNPDSLALADWLADRHAMELVCWQCYAGCAISCASHCQAQSALAYCGECRIMVRVRETKEQ